LVIALVCMFFDSGTAFITSRFAPDIFARYEQNDRIRQAFIQGDLSAYLEAEALTGGMVLVFFGLALFRPVFFGPLIVVFPIMALTAASTNLMAIFINPTATSFLILEFVIAFAILFAFLIPGRRFYAQEHRRGK